MMEAITPNPPRNGEGDRAKRGGGGPRLLQAVVGFLFAAAVPTLGSAATPRDVIDQTEKSLLEQMRCEQPTQLALAINAMLKNKLIRYGDNEDGIYMFMPTEPLKFLGLPIKLISGFDDKSFHRVPGSRIFTTVPPIHLEIDVAAPVSVLKKRALGAGLTGKQLWIASGGNYTSHFGGKIPRTSSITCLSR